jgi:hypothetical protein
VGEERRGYEKGRVGGTGIDRAGELSLRVSGGVVSVWAGKTVVVRASRYTERAGCRGERPTGCCVG